MPARGIHNLPAQRTRLIGREQEAATLRGLVLSAEGRLVTLTGAGGCGKTRLALHVAGELLDRFPDGVWLVELAGLSDPGLVPQAVAAVFELREEPGRSLSEALADWLEPRALLLVLDNCEHLVDASARLAEALLERCPRLRILATSREPLRIPGEVSWRVPSLRVPDVGRAASAEEVLRYAAARLFVERAQAAQPGFALTAQNAAAVAQICARLDGIPLALELAAARVRALAAGQILERLRDCFLLLSEGARTAPTRQQTLKATLDWSSHLLSVPEQGVFRRLAVFAGGWTLEAAEAVCAGEGIVSAEVLNLLTRLVDKSLVVAEEQQGEARYRLLEPIRQYAQGWLSRGVEEEAARRRHALYELELAERADPELRRATQGVWLSRLDREHDNLRAALRWAIDRGDAEIALRLGGALAYFWIVRMSLSEGLRWLEAGLALPGEVSTVVRAKALSGAGFLAWNRGEYATATRLSQQALALQRELGDAWGMGLSFMNLGFAAGYQGDLASAYDLHRQSYLLWRQTGDPWAIAQALQNMGDFARYRGQLEKAGLLYMASLALQQRAGDAFGMALSLAELGLVARDQHDYERAAARAVESLRLLREQGSTYYVPDCLELLAAVASAQGQPERAARLFGAAEALRQEIGAPVPPPERAAHASRVSAARAGCDAAAFAAAWAAGRAMRLEEAITYALLAEPAPPRVPPAPPEPQPPASPLSRREQEVAVLVAHGLTNRQIAAELVVGESTVQTHVSNILNKLGLSSRAQIAAWAARQRLLGRPG